MASSDKEQVSERGPQLSQVRSALRPRFAEHKVRTDDLTSVWF